MKREQLEHVLRAAATITGDPDVLVIGSQSVLGAIPEQRLPFEATASIEVDVTFFDDPQDEKSDQVDGAIGELSPFHELYGYYAQGVSVSTAVLPAGWQARVIVAFAGALLREGLIDADVLSARVGMLGETVHPAIRERVHRWVQAQRIR